MLSAMKPKLLLCLALVLSGGLFGCSKPLRQTHQEIALSNGGIINIDCTWHPENDFVNQNVTYKTPGGGKNEDIYGGNFGGPIDASEVSSYVAGPLVVVIIGEPIMVRDKRRTMESVFNGDGFSKHE